MKLDKYQRFSRHILQSIVCNIENYATDDTL